MKYINYSDYSRTMDLHNGTVEVVWHCGRCMTIKAFRGADCSYCKAKYARQMESLNRLKAQKEVDRGEDLI